ncbi:MAG: glucokinase [Gemmataceae bacterium]|nr:glucokinase [Gemmataceae bacterium]
MILAGDIGGTKTVLGLFQEDKGHTGCIRQAVFPSKGHKSLEEILEKFLIGEKNLAIQAGCFGVAGAVLEGKCQTTNLPWQLDENHLAQFIQARQVRLLNDLESAAFGMLFLQPEELLPLNPEAQGKRKGNIAVLAAGTGLGEAILFWDGEMHHPSASEGGHTDFAPSNEIEYQLWKWLSGRFPGHVSYERTLSGPGILNVFHFLTETGQHSASPGLIEKLKSPGDASALVAQAALEKSDSAAMATMDLFCSIYGAEAGNLALKCLSSAGVFIGGGIAPKILPILKNGKFLEAFYAKGRFSSLMRSMPISLALNPQAPLIGAANYACRMANKSS